MAQPSPDPPPFFFFFLSHIFYFSRLQCQVIHLITLSTFQLELPLIINDMGKLSSDEVSYAVELTPYQVSSSRFFFPKISYLFPKDFFSSFFNIEEKYINLLFPFSYMISTWKELILTSTSKDSSASNTTIQLVIIHKESLDLVSLF